MKRKTTIIVIAVALLVLVTIALAQNGGFQVPWQRIAAGGGTSTDEVRYTLSGTMGQAEAGVASDGGRFALSGGYWGRVGPVSGDYAVYLPLVIRSGK